MKYQKDNLDFLCYGGHIRLIFSPELMIMGILTSTPAAKTTLVSSLTDHGLIENGQIFGHAVDDFIRVGNTITPDMIKFCPL